MESNKPPVPERKNWDKGEWTEKARDKDRESKAFAQARDKAMREGRKFRPDDVRVPGATGYAQAHGVDISKNLGKTMLVSNAAGTGQRGAGFYCELCNRTLKDSLSYLDHLNSNFHLGKLGQSTHVARSTVAQVRARIAQLREQSKTKVDAKNYDFNQRLEEVRSAEREKREARRDERRRKRAEEREREELARLGVEGKRGEKEVEAAVAAQQSMEDMMGFGGFGGSKRQ
ncbi:hypothetical protein CcaverHIS002_0103020 [Cutaneotrichosporon cavernicola]|uniref:C2H2-type domain-containing protein n=1 Tax=Cutaneotrichosporon cavernicola TaxID=279322 RepID=A0AA48L1V8_9TREE|nr:uncharacterized protein CcaverHIS019_0102960 [Cutaneotrichosporon cavernicola]BEI79773.1 hypothetical protein CcaverHIS002_0103020 [Cutaneotrichosporon cavernicola]BEI87578.1 hypothetical protein CcaverHIS019_0102960 [Cutaneotrichosporon cavernicola]BEI95349.1 hypothetical protein CcaverHIS631_0102980 [Cutaneotrichosporon cavernicola]BEJ03123.1 hypothetical protein CcaverHIS641_0102980 [Cutaneotrichosporon cavernicola]